MENHECEIIIMSKGMTENDSFGDSSNLVRILMSYHLNEVWQMSQSFISIYTGCAQAQYVVSHVLAALRAQYTIPVFQHVKRTVDSKLET